MIPIFSATYRLPLNDASFPTNKLLLKDKSPTTFVFPDTSKFFPILTLASLNCVSLSIKPLPRTTKS